MGWLKLTFQRITSGASGDTKNVARAFCGHETDSDREEGHGKKAVIAPYIVRTMGGGGFLTETRSLSPRRVPGDRR